MKKKTLLLLILLALFITGCSSDKKEEEKKEISPLSMITEAEPYSYEKIQEKEWYAYFGKVQTISDNIVKLGESTYGTTRVIAEISDKSLKDVKEGDYIVVLGQVLEKAKPTSFVRATVLDKETVEKNFVLAVVSKDRNNYSEYVYDKKIGQIVSYRVSGNESGTYTLKYNENGKLIEKTLSKGDEQDTQTYTYNEKGLLHKEKETYNYDHFRQGNEFEYTYQFNSNGQISKETIVNISDEDKYTTIYTYEKYDGDKVLQKTEHGKRSKYSISYEYDSFGNLIYEYSREIGGTYSNTIRYQYAIVANKNK